MNSNTIASGALPLKRASQAVDMILIRPVAKNFHHAQPAATPVTVGREGEHPLFPVVNQFDRMFWNVWIVGCKLDDLLRLGEAIQDDSVIDGDARKMEQMHERHTALMQRAL